MFRTEEPRTYKTDPRSLCPFSRDLRNPTATQHFIAIIEHGGLARSDGALRLEKFDRSGGLGVRFHARCGAGMIVANLHVPFYRVARRQRSNPIHFAHAKAAAEKLPVFSHHDAILR